MEPNWLEWARKLNALAQTGLTFAENPYDIERYTTIRTIAAEMIAHGSGGDTSRVLDLFACDAGYATPKVDVRGVVFQDGKILLVQERSDVCRVQHRIKELRTMGAAALRATSGRTRPVDARHRRLPLRGSPCRASLLGQVEATVSQVSDRRPQFLHHGLLCSGLPPGRLLLVRSTPRR